MFESVHNAKLVAAALASRLLNREAVQAVLLTRTPGQELRYRMMAVVCNGLMAEYTNRVMFPRAEDDYAISDPAYRLEDRQDAAWRLLGFERSIVRAELLTYAHELRNLYDAAFEMIDLVLVPANWLDMNVLATLAQMRSEQPHGQVCVFGEGEWVYAREHFEVYTPDYHTGWLPPQAITS